MNGTLANGATVVAGGRFGNAVSLANGASVNINNPIVDLGNNAQLDRLGVGQDHDARRLDPHQGRRRRLDLRQHDLLPRRRHRRRQRRHPQRRALRRRLLPGLHRRGRRQRQRLAPGDLRQQRRRLRDLRRRRRPAPVARQRRLRQSPTSATSSAWASPPTPSPADGTVNFNGLLDSVQFYSQALSAGADRRLVPGPERRAAPDHDRRDHRRRRHARRQRGDAADRLAERPRRVGRRRSAPAS